MNNFKLLSNNKDKIQTNIGKIFLKSFTVQKEAGLRWRMLSSRTWMVSQSFDCPHNVCHAAPLSCHMDGWGREQQQKPRPPLLCTFCLCTHFLCVTLCLCLPQHPAPLPPPADRQSSAQKCSLFPWGLHWSCQSLHLQPYQCRLPPLSCGPRPRSIGARLSARSTGSVWMLENTHR